MKQTIGEHQFIDAFRDCGRYGGDNDNFSYEALQLLFEWFEVYEDSTGEEQELDPIAICCDFTEMTKEELLSNFDEIELHTLNSEEEDEEEIADYLDTNTLYVGKTEKRSLKDWSVFVEPTFVFQSF